MHWWSFLRARHEAAGAGQGCSPPARGVTRVPQCGIVTGLSAVLLLASLPAVTRGEERNGSPAEVPEWAHVASEQLAEAKKHGVPVAFENDLGMRFVLVPAGTFLMGSPEDEVGRHSSETLHKVTITRPYYMQAMEVTNEKIRRVFPRHDSGYHYELTLNGAHQPAVDMDFTGAQEFAQRLSQSDEHREYRLPTEAEWEYACRAGSNKRYWWGNAEEDAKRNANVADKAYMIHPAMGARHYFEVVDGHLVSAPVGSYEPNAWGLWDMIGNVLEFCSDWYGPYPQGPVEDPTGPESESRHRVTRGGSWKSGPRWCRCAAREWSEEQPRAKSVRMVRGFRLVSPMSEDE
jgi:formylglycine-generating enzyme required for sulfatase activity